MKQLTKEQVVVLLAPLVSELNQRDLRRPAVEAALRVIETTLLRECDFYTAREAGKDANHE